MSKQNGTVVPPHKGMSKLEQPIYVTGTVLEADDLNRMTSYTQELSRLLFRSFFGCGVICGLKVGVDNKCGWHVTVHAGVGLDCSGDPIHVPKNERFSLTDHCESIDHNVLWVVLCGRELCCAPRTSLCASDDDKAISVCTRKQYGFEIRVVGGDKPPKCVCGCLEVRSKKTEESCQCANPGDKCYDKHYRGECGCACGECSDCDCKCILLARLDSKIDDGETIWNAAHSVRRFIRPVLIQDPLLEEEAELDEQASVIIEQSLQALPKDREPVVSQKAKPIVTSKAKKTQS